MKELLIKETADVRAESLNKQFHYYQQEKFSDIIVRIEDLKFPDIKCHKLVLASNCPYFRKHLERSGTYEEIVLSGVDYEAVRTVVEYLYTQSIYLCEDNARKVMEVAKMLELTGLQDAIVDFMISIIEPSECLKTRDFLVKLDMADGLARVEQYIRSNFCAVTKSEDFQHANVDYVKELISSSDIIVKTETDVYEAVKTWLNVDLVKRKRYLTDLMMDVRIPLMELKYINDTLTFDPLLTDCPKIQLFIKESNYYILTKDFRDNQHIVTSKHITPRRYQSEIVTQSHWIMCIAGDLGESERDDSIELSSDQGLTWKFGPNIHNSRSSFSATECNGYIYVIGGYDINGGLLNSCERYDPMNGTWEHIFDLPEERAEHSVSSVHNKIFVTGGKTDAAIYSATTLCLNCDAPAEWIFKKPMSTERRAHTSCGLNGYLYVIGGTSTRSCEKYDPIANNWCDIASSIYRRDYASCTVLHNNIYVLGGRNWNVTDDMAVVERYDSNSNEWTLLTSSMNIQRLAPSLVVSDGKLCLMGGQDQDGNITDTVEEYNEKSKQWRVTGKLNKGRFGHSSVAFTI